jgi:hypothetical protein
MGDGANDLKMMGIAGSPVAFRQTGSTPASQHRPECLWSGRRAECAAKLSGDCRRFHTIFLLNKKAADWPLLLLSSSTAVSDCAACLACPEQSTSDFKLLKLSGNIRNAVFSTEKSHFFAVVGENSGAPGWCQKDQMTMSAQSGCCACDTCTDWLVRKPPAAQRSVQSCSVYGSAISERALLHQLRTQLLF